MTQHADELRSFRRTVRTRSGVAACLDTGGQHPPALLVHGLATSSELWRHVLAELMGERRCVAVDLPLHGRTPARPDQDLSLRALAEFLCDVCDALDLDQVDLVANDTGGAVAQVLAGRHPDRLRSLILTDCEVHDNVPPKRVLPAVLMARLGLVAPLAPRLLGNLGRARRIVYGEGYERLDRLPLAQVEAWLRPLVGSAPAVRTLQRWLASQDPKDLLEVEPRLRRLDVPTLVGAVRRHWRTLGQ